jgi:transcription initiation factor TFIIB
MVEKFKLLKCLRCGKSETVTDAETGEMVCGACGFVFSERIESSAPEWRSFLGDGSDKSRIGNRITLSKHDMGLATIINPANRDATGKVLSNYMKMTIKRLRIWDSHSQNKPLDRNMKDAFNELYKMKDKLALPDAVTEKAAYIYRKALEKNLVRGRSILTMMAASLYVACRDAETPRTIKDVADVANIKKRDLAVCYRILLKEFDLKIPVVDPVQCIIRIANKAGLSEKTKRDAVNIIRKAEQKKISAGKNPMGLAATALYLACLENGEDFTQKEIAIAANVTEVTLRNRIKGFKMQGLYTMP